MTITEFLLARITEDETRARAAAGATAWRSDGPQGPESYVLSLAGERLFTFDMEAMIRCDGSTLALGEHVAEWLPGRVLVECEAKRRIVELHEPGPGAWCSETCESESPDGCDTLRALALPYADHPDYDEAWRP